MFLELLYRELNWFINFDVYSLVENQIKLTCYHLCHRTNTLHHSQVNQYIKLPPPVAATDLENKVGFKYSLVGLGRWLREG